MQHYQNGVPVVPSRSTKVLRRVKKVISVDSRDRLNNPAIPSGTGTTPIGASEYVIYLPESLKNVYSVRLLEAEFENVTQTTTRPPHVLMEIEYMNNVIEGSLNNRSKSTTEARAANTPTNRTDGFFAKIPLLDAQSNGVVYFFDKTEFTNESILTPPLDKLSTLRIKFRNHKGDRMMVDNEHTLLLEVQCLESGFDEFSSLELAH